MPLPFQFEGKGVVDLDLDLDFVVPYAHPLVHFQDLVNKKRKKYFIINEPTSVLDNITTSPASTSTLSSSHGGADTAAAGVAALSSKWPPSENQETTTSNVAFLDLHHFQPPPPPPPPPVEISAGNDKCGGMDDWENGDSGQDQAMLRWILGDVEDPSIGFNKILHSGAGAGACSGAPADFDFSGGFGVVDQGFISLDSGNQITQIGNLPINPQIPPPQSPEMFNHHHHHQHHQNQIFPPLNDTQLLQFDIKPNLFNTQFLIPPQNQTHNPLSLEYNPPMHNNHYHQQGIIDQLFKAADLIQSGTNPILAQGILARLNQQLSQAGKPFDRAAFYFKQALHLLLQSIVNNINPQITPTDSPFSLIFKIGAYKSFSEISPFIQFANFTSNQAVIESVNGFDQIHVIDFDIGYGGQWASLMQELTGVSYIKITAFVSPSTHNQLELGLTRENLIHCASEINVGFDFEIVNIDVLVSNSWALPFHVSDNEAIAVNLPIHVFSNHQTQIPALLRFVKSLAPKIVVSVDRGCDRTDLPFSNHVIHALQSYSNLLDSLDAVNVGADSVQKIERFLVQPAIEKIVLGRFVYPEKTQHWRNLFVSAGFSPMVFSNFTESQAECLVKRTPVREFHVEKRQSLLVLCWQRRELMSVSAWK